MFINYYGLREQPFGVTPDPRFLYFGDAHREALASLVYGIEAGLGFASLIAEPGTGKTTLLYYLLNRYRTTARTAFIFDTQCTSRELLRNLLLEFEIGDFNDDSIGMLNRLKQFLAAQAVAKRRVLLVLDEAQNLDDSVLETVRLLSNFETAQSKLLHIVLSGQPQLEEKLAKPELLNVRQRITILNRLHPFAPRDVVKYIAHRLGCAGYNGGSLFTAEALEMIASQSRGVPREINRICFNAMSLGFALQRKVIDSEVLNEVALDLQFGARTSGFSSLKNRPATRDELAAEFAAALPRPAMATSAATDAPPVAPPTAPALAEAMTATSAAPKEVAPPAPLPVTAKQEVARVENKTPVAQTPVVRPVTAFAATNKAAPAQRNRGPAAHSKAAPWEIGHTAIWPRVMAFLTLLALGVGAALIAEQPVTALPPAATVPGASMPTSQPQQEAPPNPHKVHIGPTSNSENRSHSQAWSRHSAEPQTAELPQR